MINPDIQPQSRAQPSPRYFQREPFAYQPVAYIAPNSLPQFNHQALVTNFATPQVLFKPFPDFDLFPPRNSLQRNVDFLQRYASVLNEVLHNLQHSLATPSFSSFPSEERPPWPSAFGPNAPHTPRPAFPWPHWPAPTIKPVIEVAHDADFPSTAKPNGNVPIAVQPAAPLTPTLPPPPPPLPLKSTNELPPLIRQEKHD